MSSRCPELAACILLALALAGCDREERAFRGEPPRAAGAPFQGNAYAMGEGKLLYSYFNCVGCHAHGGGGIGPPLMDDEWLYGSQPENVYASIVQGRPNGMPAFGGRIPADRVWWLVAYVRSMSGLPPMDARPGRSDEMHVKEPEILTGRREPRSDTPPPASR